MSSLNNGEWGTLHRTRPRESVPQLTNRRVLLPDAQKELDGVRQCDAVVLHGPRTVDTVPWRYDSKTPIRAALPAQPWTSPPRRPVCNATTQ